MRYNKYVRQILHEVINMSKKNLFAPIKLDSMEILMNRSGKADGRLPEVRTGCGVFEDKRFKKPKHKTNWRDE